MFVLQVKLDLSCLDGICDDMDFCCRLAKEESVIVLPGANSIFFSLWLPKEICQLLSLYRPRKHRVIELVNEIYTTLKNGSSLHCETDGIYYLFPYLLSMVVIETW